LIPESAVHYYPFSREFPPDLSFNSVLNMHVVYVEDSSISATFVRSAASSTSIKDLGVVLATSVSYATRTREEYQPTLVYYNGGHFIGHQPLTWTNFPSQYPVVTGDSTDALYAVWIDNTGVGFHYPVYLAGTSSAIRAKFQYLRLGDLAVIGWDWVNRVVSGIVLLPFIIEWYLLPVGLLVILMVLGDRYGRGRMYGLLMSVYLYWASKYIITPQLLAILPDYRFLPRFFEPLLPSGIPLCVLSVSLLIAAVCQRSIKREDISLFAGFLYITVPDALLSLVIYAIGGFG
jgi:hypothetical protein